MFVWISKWVKHVHDKNKCKQMKGGRWPINKVWQDISLKNAENVKKIKIQYVVNIFHMHFQSTARQRLRRAAVSWTVIEPQQNHPKSSFMKDSSSVHWFLAFIWEKCNVRICSVKTVLPAQLFIFSNRKNWLFTYIYS